MVERLKGAAHNNSSNHNKDNPGYNNSDRSSRAAAAAKVPLHENNPAIVAIKSLVFTDLEYGVSQRRCEVPLRVLDGNQRNTPACPAFFADAKEFGFLPVTDPEISFSLATNTISQTC